MTSQTSKIRLAMDKAETLIEALPWIQKFAGSTMVVK
jgi:acetylglutamate kinase